MIIIFFSIKHMFWLNNELVLFSEYLFRLSEYFKTSKFEFLRFYCKNLCETATLKTPKLVFKTNYRLMQVKSIAECSKGRILQYFWPKLPFCYD